MKTANVDLAIKAAGICRRTLYNWIYAGWVRSVGERNGRRVRMDDVMAKVARDAKAKAAFKRRHR